MGIGGIGAVAVNAITPSSEEIDKFTEQQIESFATVDAVKNGCDEPIKLADGAVEYYNGQYTLMMESGVDKKTARNAAVKMAMKKHKEQCPDKE